MVECGKPEPEVTEVTRLAQGGKAWPKLSDHISLVIIIRSLRSPDLRIIIFKQ